MSTPPTPGPLGGKRPKGRSPSYPAINLERAIYRAEETWEKERQHATPVETIVEGWGYRSLNGPGSLSVAALKKYGLMDEEGARSERKAWVTDLAVRILKHPDEAVRQDAIREAALKPSINAELWSRYGSDLPSNAALRWELTRSLGFTETGADEFIPVYKQTIAFAGLDDDAQVAEAVSPHEEDEDDERNRPAPVSAGLPTAASIRTRGLDALRMSMASADIRTIDIPLPAGRSVGFTGPFPLTEAEWRQMQAVLDVMKPGLVALADD